MRVLVTGSRDWPAVKVVFEALSLSYTDSEPFILVHGKCRDGVDAMAQEWADEMNRMGYPVIVEPHPADWKKFGKAAGMIRNAEMVSLGADLCLAFIYNESRGATDCRNRALKAGIETKTFARSSNMALPVRRIRDELTLYSVQLIFRNFEGREEKFNAKGNRNFSIRLDESSATELMNAGWNVRTKPPRMEGDEPLYHLPVKVHFREGFQDPRLILITESTNSRNPLDEETAMLIDRAVFDNIDVTLRPYNWDVQGNQGVKAYLKTFYGTLHEDPLDLKYAHYQNPGDLREIENYVDVESEDDPDWINDNGLEIEQ